MMEDWKEYKIDEITDYNPSIKLEKGKIYAQIEMEDVEPYSRFIKSNKTIVFDGNSGSKFKNGDILFARITPCLENRKIGQATIPNYEFGIGSTEFFVLRAKEGFDHIFLLYLMKTDFVVENAVNSMVGASGRQRADWNYIKKVKLKLPPLSIQQKIADILGKYDALIENCEQQISTLETTAKEIYREWFVRGRCPLGNEGWEKKRLGDIALDKRNIIKPKDFEENTPYVGLEHLSIKSITIRNFGVVEDVESDKLRIEKGDILFGKIRAYLHKVCLSHFDGVCSSDAIVIKPIEENSLGFVLFTVFDDWFIDFADNISNGTKMPRAEWSVLKTCKINVPPNSVLAAFDEIVIPIFKKIENLQQQIQTLRKTRDALLPRLMSGQLRVHTVEN